MAVTEHASFAGGADSAARAERDELGRVRPGSRLNPHGRPRKGEAMTDRLRYYAENFTVRQLRAIRVADLTPKDAHAVRQLLVGLKLGADSLRARAYTYNRLDGLPRQTVDVNTDAQERTDDLFDRMAAFVLGDQDAAAALDHDASE